MINASTRLLLLLLLACSATTAHAQPRAGAQYDSVLDDPFVAVRAEVGLNLVYDMRFDEANLVFSEVDKKYPDHPIGPFLKALTTWWKILLDLSDNAYDARFYAAMDEVIRRSDRLLARDKNDFDAMFFKGAALGFRGRLRSNRGDWFKAGLDGKRAMDYVLSVARKHPGNHDYIFGKGIYDYYADVVPERYPFTKPIMVFFPRGNRLLGIRELERTASRGRFLQTEAAYFLLQIYYLFENDREKTFYYADLLRKKHPNNPFFHAFQARVQYRWGEWDKAEESFERIIRAFREKKPGYNQAAAEQSFYYIARIRMNMGLYADAMANLSQLERLTRERPTDTYFKVWGLLRQGMALDALGNRTRAVEAYRQVLRMKNWGDAHETARRYLDRPNKGA